MIDRRLAAGIRWSFLGLAFFLPLLVSTRSSEVFELPKMLFVYAMTAVIVGLWLSRMLAWREILIRRTPLDIPILLFLISQMASTIYSIDPAVSWWGWYGRFHGGLWSTISYTLLYYAFVSNLESDSNEESPWRPPAGVASTSRRLLFTITASAIIVSIYAILQHFGVDKDFWVQDVVNRVFSTQGQPNWLAAYLTMALPLSWAIAIVKAKGQRPKAKGDTGTDALSPWPLALILIFFLALLWTKSRSGLVGLAVADAVFWFVSLAKFRFKISDFRIYKQFMLIHAIMMILILVTNNPAREWMLNNGIATSSRRDVGTPRNDGNIDPAMESGITLRKSRQGGTESGDIRRLVWNGAIQLVKQRPVFGFGPETFGETYWRVRPKEHNLTSEWNFLYNKAHNEWLNLAANTGLFGLGSHLLLLGWFSAWSIKRSLLGVRQGDSLINTAILAALLGVEVVNFFGFSTVTVGAYRYLFMAMAVTIRSKKQEIRNNGSSVSGDISIITSFFLFLISLSILYLLSRLFIFFLADLAYNRGRAYQDGGYIEEAVEPLAQAVNLAPGEPVFRAELGEAEGTLANFEIIRKQSPYNLGFIRTQARILFLLGEEERAVQLMKAAMEMAPTNPQLPYSLGQMVSKMGNEEEAAVYYNKALELKPDYGEARKMLNL